MDSLIRGLLRPGAYDHPITHFEVLETHISWVILTGPYAYKLKKPVDLGFVDFTTLERRKFFCEEELRLNRRLAPELYVAVCPVLGPANAPTLHGNAPPIDYAVQMRQFPQDALLPAVLTRNALTIDQLDHLSLTIASFHRAAAETTDETPYGTPEAIWQPMADNLTALAELAQFEEAIAALRTWCEQQFAQLRDWFTHRRSAGRVRECHGDMHLGNMVMLDGVVHVFDCLEFNPELRWTDVIAEIAFLVMDFEERGRPDFGFHVLNRWLEETGDYDALVGWRWYFAYRALVRAKVAALRLEQNHLSTEDRDTHRRELRNYLELATNATRPRPRPLILMRGVSGSGKSFVAERICRHFGAIRLRSDVERKRLFGQWGDPGSERLSGDMYTPRVTDLVYREMLARQARQVIDADFPVVVDATFLERQKRALFQKLAEQLAIPFLIVDVQARPETRRQRLRARQQSGTDPSDADEAIMNQQRAKCDSLTPGEQPFVITVDTDADDWETRLHASLRPHLLPPPNRHEPIRRGPAGGPFPKSHEF